MWDYYVAKAPVSLPKIKIKTQTEKDLVALLRPIREIALPDSDSDCSSGVTDPFEEFHKDSFLRPLPGTKTKFLTKLEADWKTVEQFTNDYKLTIQELRKELPVTQSLTTETVELIEQELHNTEKYIFFNSAKNSHLEDPIIIPAEVAESDTTSNSAVWNMIKAYQRDYFFASPPHYDIYDPSSEHYLMRPPVSWTEVEQSRIKCEKWLKSCQTN